MTKLLKPLDVIASQPLGFESIKEVGTQVMVAGSVFQKVVDDDQNGMPTAIKAGFLPRRPARCRY